MRVTISTDPTIFTVGAFQLRWYSLALVLAVAVGVWFTRREFDRKGIDGSSFGPLAVWAIAGGIAGARVFHLFGDPRLYLHDPAHMLDFQAGGLTIYGAIAGGFVGVAFGCRQYLLPFLRTIDAIAPGLALALAIGRVGCIVDGDAWGARTSFPVALVYTNPNASIPDRLLNQPTHPYPVYAMALNLALFGLLLWLRRKRLPDGALFAAFIGVYALGSFVLTFVRDETTLFWSPRPTQIIALVALALAAASLLVVPRNQPSARLKVSLESEPAADVPSVTGESPAGISSDGIRC